MIRKAELGDIHRITEIIKLCSQNMIVNGIFQWNEEYPNANILINDIKKGELFVVEENQIVLGCIVISTQKDEVYNRVEWLTSDSIHFYIHRLAIHPDNQGKGYAQKLMNFAEEKAQNEEIASIRLDTFSQNQRNQHFYEQRGYQRLQEIYFPMQSKFPFYCYELLI